MRSYQCIPDVRWFILTILTCSILLESLLSNPAIMTRSRTSNGFSLVLLLSFSRFLVGQGFEAEDLRILPSRVELTNLQPSQWVSVRQQHSDGSYSPSLEDATENHSEVLWTIEDPEIAEFEVASGHGKRVRAKKSGTTNLIATLSRSGQTPMVVRAPIHAQSIEQHPEWEFTNHVQSILARQGCNMGACHGALAGKGGFRLSLRGYDPISDHFNIAKQDRGRRIELLQPESSLILAKPSGDIEHQGGLRLPKESENYRILLDWIATGASNQHASDPVLSRLEILPEAVLLTKGSEEQLTVLAHYSNGRTEDVTRWSKFNSSDESVALVDEHGTVKTIGPGEGSIVAWFASRIVSSRIRIPFGESLRPDLSLASIREKLGRANDIDDHVANQLAALGLEPSDRINDTEFLRRSSLDATGTLPSEAKVLEFLADPSPEKRAKWIESLLDSPEYVDYWTYRWSDVLMLNSNLIRTDGVKAYYQWIHQNVEKNTPWDAMVRDILTARGEALENGATNFYAINQDPEGMTENACQAFLGLSIGCAKCHNHPLEKWTNDQYYAMANMFARVRAKGWGGEVRDGDASRTVYVLDRGDLIQPLRGKPQPPAPLDAPSLDIDSPADRRVALARWMTSPENPYFTRAIVNRVWAAYFGIGIIHPVDDLRASNPPSNPALLDALCQSLVADKYDLKQLMRHIMNSETYQRSSVSTDGNHGDRKYFSRYYPRRLMAEVIHDAIATVTDVPTEFNKVAFLGGDKRDTKFYPKGTRAIQLYDSSVDSNFLKTFGRNQRRITCECERSDEPSIIQVLNLSNGDTLNAKLTEQGGIVDRWLAQYESDLPGLVRAAYLRTLSRSPTEAEQSQIVHELQQTDTERRVLVEDLLWSLMSSREFLFNH